MVCFATLLWTYDDTECVSRGAPSPHTFSVVRSAQSARLISCAARHAQAAVDLVPPVPACNPA
jgi:hypothetical protein